MGTYPWSCSNSADLTNWLPSQKKIFREIILIALVVTSVAGVTKPISPVPSFTKFFTMVKSWKHTLATPYHLYIWQVSPQLSCGDTCQIYRWFKEINRYFLNIENFPCGEISERSVSISPPKVQLTEALKWQIMVWVFGLATMVQAITPSECDFFFMCFIWRQTIYAIHVHYSDLKWAYLNLYSSVTRTVCDKLTQANIKSLFVRGIHWCLVIPLTKCQYCGNVAMLCMTLSCNCNTSNQELTKYWLLLRCVVWNDWSDVSEAISVYSMVSDGQQLPRKS